MSDTEIDGTEDTGAEGTTTETTVAETSTAVTTEPAADATSVADAESASQDTTTPQSEAAEVPAAAESTQATQTEVISEMPVAGDTTPSAEVTSASSTTTVEDIPASISAPVIEEVAEKTSDDNNEIMVLDGCSLAGYSPEVRQLIRNVYAGDDASAIQALSVVLGYVENMSPKAVVREKDGCMYQINFFRTLQHYINFGGSGFRQFFITLLAIVNELKADNVFNERYALRFLPNMAMGHEDRQAFQSLYHILVTTSNPSTRFMSIKQIDMNHALKHGYTAEGRQRLLNFYHG